MASNLVLGSRCRCVESLVHHLSLQVRLAEFDLRPFLRVPSFLVVQIPRPKLSSEILQGTHHLSFPQPPHELFARTALSPAVQTPHQTSYLQARELTAYSSLRLQ